MIVSAEEDVPLQLLDEYMKRRGLQAQRQFSRGSPGLGSTAMNIDIGYSEAVLKEVDLANRQRMVAGILRKRQLSLDSQLGSEKFMTACGSIQPTTSRL